MVKFGYRSKQGEIKDISAEQVAKLLGAVVKTEIFVKDGIPTSTKRLIYFLASSVIFLVVTIAIFGWEYETKKEFTNDGMVRIHHYVELLSVDLPNYKTEQVSRTDYIRESLEQGGMDSNLMEGQPYGVRDGKVIVKRYRLDINEHQSAKTN